MENVDLLFPPRLGEVAAKQQVRVNSERVDSPHPACGHLLLVGRRNRIWRCPIKIAL